MVTIESETSWEQIEAGIRQVPLLNRRDVFPYADATITLKEIPYSEVRTTSLYVANNLLAVQEAIAKDIAEECHRPLDMEGGLILGSVIDGEQKLTGFIPPIVEETDEEGMYVLDGSHRTNLGRWAGRMAFRAIHISGIREDCPAYAYPNEWNEVVLYDEVPTEPSLRKAYREPELLYGLYRDFGALNGSQPRYPIDG